MDLTRITGLSVSALLASLVLGGCVSPEPEALQPRLVLLYATCTLNKDYLSPYNPDLSFTPNLARFADEAVVFRRHMSEAGQSGIAYASLLTGLQADGHGIFRHPTVLDEDVETLGEVFRDGGWEVHAWLEHGMASGELGYAQGAGAVHDTLFRAGDPEVATLLDGLAADPSRRALVIVNFTVTHGPYQLAPLDAFCAEHPELCGAAADREAFLRYAEFYRRGHAFLSYDFPTIAERSGLLGGEDSSRHLENLVEAVDLLYRANVARLDRLFGEVTRALRERGLWDESLVAFTADHGETLFRDGTYFKWTHGGQLAPEVLNVPFVLRAPGIAPRSYEPVTRSTDVLPTLSSLAGLPVPTLGDGPDAAATTGVDLAPALRGEVPPPVLPAYSHTSLLPEPIAEASRKWNVFHRLYPRIDPELMWVQRRDGDRVVQLRRDLDGEVVPALFDLAADPLTLENLFDPRDGEHRRALSELERYRRHLIDAWQSRHATAETPSTERQEELLRGLGYID